MIQQHTPVVLGEKLCQIFAEWRKVIVSTGLEGKDERMRGKGKVWILLLGCQTSKLCGPSMNFILKKGIPCNAALLWGVNSVRRGRGVYLFYPLLNSWPHLFLWKRLSLGHTEVWLCFSWTCLFPHEVPALPQSSCFCSFSWRKKQRRRRSWRSRRRRRSFAK